MQIPSSTAYSPPVNSAAGAKNVAQTDAAFAELLEGGDDPKKILAEIMKDGMSGYWAWQIKEMKKKAAEKVMQGMGVTAESIAAMPPDQRADIERKIMQEVERMVREHVENEARKKQGLAFEAAPAATATGVNLLA